MLAQRRHHVRCLVWFVLLWFTGQQCEYRTIAVVTCRWSDAGSPGYQG